MLKNIFKTKKAKNTPLLPEAEMFLLAEGIKYEICTNGIIFVDQSIDLSYRSLKKLPDLSSVHLTGDFLCHNNQLKDLKGAPSRVRNFRCDSNQLSSLEGAPKIIFGDFDCCYNQLISLANAPLSIGGKFIFCHNPLSEAEAFLRKEDIKYEHRDDGTIFVPGNINLSGRSLTKLPDLSNVDVSGAFWCHNNQLTSLAGAPQNTGRSFLCNNNQLTSLAGAPQSVGSDFSCYNNQLSSLAGAPQSVGGYFSCSNNQLTSLVGAPQTIGGNFWCDNNQLPDLYAAPHTFKELKSDFGIFTSWDEIPDDVKMSPQTKERLEKEREEKVLREIHDAMYNSPAMPFKPPPLRKRPGV